MMFATSCENELDLGANAGENAQVTFSVGTPKIATRAYSDGETATKLEYAVYSVGENDALTKLNLDGEKTFSISTTVELQLTTGNKYAVIFWAAAEDAPYDVNFNTQTMTVNYENAVSNDEKRDAFYAYHEFTVSGTQSETVYLKRPFAQLNIGTNDYAATTTAGYTPKYSYVKVPVSSTLNLVDGSVNDATDVEFKLAAIPTAEDGKFPVEGYDYLSMNYLLVPADKETVEVTFGYSEDNTTVEKTRTVGSVPVQRNHRTNIYGQLFTGDVDINVVIEPEYDEKDLPETLEEKLNIAAQLGGTVTLTGDVTLKEPLVISGVQTRAATANVAVEIDLNGYALTYTSAVAAHSAMITVNSGNKLVVKDSKGNGKISYTYTGTGDSDFGWGTYTIYNHGNLVIESGLVECLCDLNTESDKKHMYSAISQIGGSLIVNGGTVSTPKYRSIRVNKGTLTINGGTMNGQVWMQPFDGNTSLEINGGKFTPVNGDLSSVFVTNDTYNSALKVTGGTFKAKLGCSDFTRDGVKGSVSGGVFGEVPDNNLLADNYKATEKNSVHYVTPDENNIVIISTVEELNKLNARDAYVVLGADIDFEGGIMTKPIELWGNSTFNGNGYKISNLKTAVQGNYATSLFRGDANPGNKVVKNLVVDGLSTPNNYDFAAAIWSDLQNANIEIDNVRINNSTIKAKGTIGGFVGFVSAGTTSVVIKNSSISNSNLNGGEADKKRGAVVGRAYGCMVTCEDVVVNNVKINGTPATTLTLVGDKGYTGNVTVK